MRVSRNGETVGITLRVPKALYEVYSDIAKRASLIDLKKGGRGMKTAQDVMRHRLASLPVAAAREVRAAKKLASDEE